MSGIPTTERDFLTQIIQLAKLYGWLVHHMRPGWSNRGYRTPIQGDAGFPDLVLVHGEKHRIILAELKSEDGWLTDMQREWFKNLQSCVNVESYIWKPSQWENIVGILR